MNVVIDKFQNIVLSDLIAILALILASISFGWNVLNEIRNKPRAEISVMIAKMILPGTGIKDKNNYFSLTIVNIGKRPIKINGIGYKAYEWWEFPNKFRQYVILPKRLPIILNESEDHIEMFPYKPESFKKLLDDNIKELFCYDSVGGYHYVPRRKLRKFRKEIKKHLEKKETSEN